MDEAKRKEKKAELREVCILNFFLLHHMLCTLPDGTNFTQAKCLLHVDCTIGASYP